MVTENMKVYLGDLSGAVPGHPLRALLVGVVAAVFALNTLKARKNTISPQRLSKRH